MIIYVSKGWLAKGKAFSQVKDCCMLMLYRLVQSNIYKKKQKQTNKILWVHKCTQTMLGELCSAFNKDNLGTLQYRLKENMH